MTRGMYMSMILRGKVDGALRATPKKLGGPYDNRTVSGFSIIV